METQHALHDQGEYRLKVHYDGYTAILSSATQARNTWLLTGWEDGDIKKEGSPMSASGEVYDSSTATATMPTLTRHSGDIGDSSTFSIADSKNNSSTEKTSKATNKTTQQKKEQKNKQAQKESAEEKTITQGLSPEGYNVYVKTRDTLLESPSDGVREAAPYSAVLFARMCERQAEEWTRQGKKTTAEDVAKSVKIRPDATQNDAVSGESFDQPMPRENKRYVLTKAGNLNFGEIPSLKADNGTIIKGAPIRLQVGFQVGSSKIGAGYAHLLKHGGIVKKMGGVEAVVNHVLDNLDSVISKDKRLELRSKYKNGGVALILDLENDKSTGDDYYTIVTITPQERSQIEKSAKKALTFDGRQTPSAVSSYSAKGTGANAKAGGHTGLMSGNKVSAFGTVSLAGAKRFVKRFTYNQMAGEHARYAPRKKLALAKAMKAQAKSKREIWEATGWTVGNDNRWRFEIPDDISKIRDEINKPGTYRLPKIYDNKRLYTAYPALKNTLVVIFDGEKLGDWGKNTGGWFDPVDNEIFLINHKERGETTIKTSLIHEIQHWIQKMEKFAVGGSPDNIREKLAISSNSQKNAVKNVLKEYHWGPFTELQKLFDTQQKLENFMLFSDGLNGSEYTRLRAEYDKQRKKIGIPPKVIDVLLGNLHAAKNLEKAATEGDTWESYRRLAGEQETRETEKRSLVKDKSTLQMPTVHDPNALVVYSQTAYHGSPYQFDKFDLGAIGKGEGNQVHGWGLYFAKDKKLSEAYKDVLGYKGNNVDLDGKIYTQNEDGTFTADGQNVEEGSPLEYALTQLLNDKGQKELAVETLRKEAARRADSKNESVQKQNKAFLQAADLIENSNHADAFTRGKLDEVDIPNNKYLLDEQKRFWGQSKFVQKNLVKAIEELPADKQAVFIKRFANLSDYTNERAHAEGKLSTLSSAVSAIENIPKWESSAPFVKDRDKLALQRAGFTETQINKFEHSETAREKTIDELQPRIDEAKKAAGIVARKAKETLNSKIDKLRQEIPQLLNRGDNSGERIYNDLTMAFSDEKGHGGERKASEWLNQHGIKGITYDGLHDGRCFVVFDDKAISIIERYNQAVTNAYINENTKIPVFDVTNLEKINPNDSKAKAEIAKRLIGEKFSIVGSNAEGIVASMKDGKHIVGSSNNLKRKSGTRLKALSIVDQLLNNAVYVEKHDDKNHKTKTKYIELYAAVRNGDNISRIRIVVKEGKPQSGEYEIGTAQFYDFIKENTVPQQSPVGLHKRGTVSTITLSELLDGVKDKDGKPYVTNGHLNYAPGVHAIIDGKVKTLLALDPSGAPIYTHGQDGSTVRGQTAFIGQNSIISAFQGADQSTFVHEAGHWYLKNMQELAQNKNASAQFKKDFLTIQQWFGNNGIEDEITTPMHEKFARGFESYLRSGKSPVPQLKRVFARFKKWLKDIYQDLRQLGFSKGARLSSAVRNVMDRMIATQDELDESNKDAQTTTKATKENVTEKVTAKDKETKAHYSVTEAEEEGTKKAFLSGEEKLQRDIAAWSNTVDDLNNQKGIIDVMTTPLVMSYAKAAQLPVKISAGKLTFLMKKHPEMTTDIVKQIPQGFADPLVLAPSNTHPGRVVVVLDLKGANGGNVVLPLELSAGLPGGYEANIITSAYSKTKSDKWTERTGWYKKLFEGAEESFPENKRSLYYVNEQKVTSWYSHSRLQLPSREYHTSDFFETSIPNGKDLGKLKAENNALYQAQAPSSWQQDTDLARSVDNLKAEVREAFPGAKITDDGKNQLRIETGSSAITVNIKDKILVSEL